MRVQPQKFFEVVKRLELHTTTLAVLDLLMLDVEEGVSTFSLDLNQLVSELDLTRNEVDQALHELVASGLLLQVGSRQGVRLFELDPTVFPSSERRIDFVPPAPDSSFDRTDFVDL
jgi:hypothetical protein